MFGNAHHFLLFLLMTCSHQPCIHVCDALKDVFLRFYCLPYGPNLRLWFLFSRLARGGPLCKRDMSKWINLSGDAVLFDSYASSIFHFHRICQAGVCINFDSCMGTCTPNQVCIPNSSATTPAYVCYDATAGLSCFI